MPVKRIVVLANSIKIKHRCIAGREVSGNGDLGPWVRPVRPADQHSGALLLGDLRLHDGNFAAVGDIVEISVVRQTQDPGQPENWLLDHSTVWRKVGVYPNANFANFAEDVPDLWSEGHRPDCISVEAQQNRHPQRSLVMIQPSDLRIACSHETNHWEGRVQKKTFARFSYAGDDYDLKITDDLIRGHHGPFPALDAPEIVYAPPFGDNCLLCVSLTPPFRGAHWKVIATIRPLT